MHNIPHTPRSLESFTPNCQGSLCLSSGDFSLDRCCCLKFVGGTKGPAILDLYIEVTSEHQVSRSKTRKQRSNLKQPDLPEITSKSI